MTNFETDFVRDDLHAIAFYNLENLFDVYNDNRTNDNDFLPDSMKKWTRKRYDNKLRKLSFAISNIGRKETGKHPAIVGLAEVENASVIKDLIHYKHLDDYNYGYVHFNSPDERGIDVGLIYDTSVFTVLNTDTFSVELFNDNGLPDYTRDILLVSGTLDGDLIYVIVNHWASRREGEDVTEPKRMASAKKVTEIIVQIREKDENAKIIVMGDFNDDPSSDSIKTMVANSNLFNTMETLRSFSRGSTKHGHQWNLFDQIIISTNFFNNTPSHLEFEKSEIFDEDFLKLFSGKFKGTPFRTYIGKKYKGGYSDHFPVYAVFKKNI
ncbi:MAG: endonuclease/exonuclease/phosphatase family protein [Flavobacteriaceae bacterium]